jgi:hypothetical protein
MTWVRDEQEEHLLRESLALLAQEGIETYVADRSSGQEFVQFISQLPNFHILNAVSPGLFPQVKQSLRAAADSGADFVFYTEPDKKLFFDGRLRGFLQNAPTEENVGIVLASRSPESFRTFPAFQQYTETVINNLCAEVTGEAGDYTYGPFLFNKNLADCLDLAADETGWGWHPFLFAMARNRGYKIIRLEDDYPCPADQREDNRAERIYRMKQLSQNIEGLVSAAQASLISN